MPSTDILFKPFAIKSMALKNRIVMAPMTRSFATGGLPGGAHVDYYRRRAERGVGLILSEGTVIDRPGARNDPGVPFFHGAALDGWRAVIDAVHAAGGAMGPQLWHAASAISMTANWDRDTPVESPSGLLAPGKPHGDAMSDEDIADSVAGFARAAAEAKRLGFETIEVHGAHGYLVDQFFWSGTNERTDRYGGLTLRERSRFAAEVIAAIRAAVGPDYPIILRVSQWKQQDLKARLAETPDAIRPRRPQATRFNDGGTMMLGTDIPDSSSSYAGDHRRQWPIGAGSSLLCCCSWHRSGASDTCSS